MAPQGVPKSPPGSNLGGMLEDFNDLQIHFCSRFLLLVLIVREFLCEKKQDSICYFVWATTPKTFL